VCAQEYHDGNQSIDAGSSQASRCLGSLRR